MTIHLPEDLERYLQSKVQSGLFASEQAAIAEAVRRLRFADEQFNPKAGFANTFSQPAWQRVLNNMAEVPDSAIERIPADASAQLDHYIYGSPRQPHS